MVGHARCRAGDRRAGNDVRHGRTGRHCARGGTWARRVQRRSAERQARHARRCAAAVVAGRAGVRRGARRSGERAAVGSGPCGKRRRRGRCIGKRDGGPHCTGGAVGRRRDRGFGCRAPVVCVGRGRRSGRQRAARRTDRRRRARAAGADRLPSGGGGPGRGAGAPTTVRDGRDCAWSRSSGHAGHDRPSCWACRSSACRAWRRRCRRTSPRGHR